MIPTVPNLRRPDKAALMARARRKRRADRRERPLVVAHTPRHRGERFDCGCPTTGPVMCLGGVR